MSDVDTGEVLMGLAREIEEHAQKSDDHVIQAAKLLRKARKLFENADPISDSWEKWARANIDLSQSRLRDLQRIADADNPEAELERQRRLTRERVQKHRAKQTAQAKTLEKDRRDLIEWAKTAPIESITRVLAQVRVEGAEGSTSLSDAVSVVDSQAAA